MSDDVAILLIIAFVLAFFYIAAILQDVVAELRKLQKLMSNDN